jgi:GT2 family glycosyltransferase
MQISFIIVNYKSEKYLKDCVDSIIKKVIGAIFEIIIVNNDKNKIGIIKNDHIIRIIEINKNLGFSRANNIGVSESMGKYICFINPDTRIVSNNIKEVIIKFKLNPNIGIIGSMILGKNNVQKWSAGVDMDIFEILRGKFGLSKSEKIWNSCGAVEAGWVSGAGLFIKRDIFLKVGGFDENYFLYYEDVDLCKKVIKNNQKVIYFPFFKIRHLEGRSSVDKYKQKIQYFKSQDYYYRKWFNGSTCFFLKFLKVFYLWIYKIKYK